MSETCCFHELRRGELFKLVGSQQLYVYWQLSSSNDFVGLPLTEDGQDELRLMPFADFLTADKAGKCNPSGVMINNLSEIPPLPAERV